MDDAQLGSPTIRRYPDPRLRRVAQPITTFDDELKTLVNDLLACMYADHGVGLAAPQVGLSLRLFVTDHHAGQEDQEPAPRVWINPRITTSSGAMTNEEGCLSVPGIYAKVTRPSQITVGWHDLTGQEHEETFDADQGDFLAVVIQHEFDHLDGRLFIDHLSPAQLALINRRLRDLEQEYKQLTGNKGAVLRR